MISIGNRTGHKSLFRFLKWLRNIFSSMVAILFYYSGFLIIYLKIKYRKKLLVLFYHEVGDNQDKLGGIVTQPRYFNKQMKFLNKWFTPIHESAISDFFSNTMNEKYPVYVTFDGGYKGNITNAMPILEELHIPSTFYIVTNCIDKSEIPWTTHLSYIIRSTKLKKLKIKIESQSVIFNSLKDKAGVLKGLKKILYPLDSATREIYIKSISEELHVQMNKEIRFFMDWNDILQIKNSCLFTIGSHTLSHPRLNQISRKEAENEIFISKTIIEEKLGTTINSFCYPDGEVDKEIVQMVRKAGYQSATTTLNGVNNASDNPLELKRFGGANIPIYRFALKLSGLFSGILT